MVIVGVLIIGPSKHLGFSDYERPHYEDLKSGPQTDAEVKVLFLGRGVGEPFDEKNVFSTHGIQRNDMPFSLEGFSEPVRLNFWDLGNQEIYYGSHSLFLQGQAVFLILGSIAFSIQGWVPLPDR